MRETPHSATRTLDSELGPSDVQSLSNADEITAFFARLGYNTDTRTHQTPANLGITAEGTARPIKKIELIADQENLFQVYCFELTSVTVAHTRALARVFRNRTGNYLLVLTNDYERLDFVLLEKYLPSKSDESATIAPAQVSVRPRVLTVERRKPTRTQLRVLRRFTWTESDPFAQYDKLLSAYTVADWSEEFFNNRALFSDYYLLERLRERPEWIEDPKPAYSRLHQLYEGATSRFAGKEKRVLQQELLGPVLCSLGFDARPGKKSGSSAVEPDYRLYSPAATSGRTQDSPLQQTPLALCLVYPWGRSLDGKDDQRDKETSEENPGAVVVSLLEGGEASWVLVTNGKLWRLYAQRTHSRATNYYEIDLEELLAQTGPHTADLAEAFRYFWLLFRLQAFEPVEVEREGKKIALSLLDQLFLESEDYAKKLGERLKERVFEEVFPHLAAGFIAHIRERDGLHADLPQEMLDAVFQGTLTLLYRLLFLLYAEARDLLPVKEVRGYFEASLTKLKREVAEAAGSIADEVENRLKKPYRDDRYELCERLAHLFQVVDKGDPALNVPVYNGGLFLSNPEDRDESPEAQAARFLNTTRVPDRFLARALDLLARDVDPKRHDLAFIDYKSLGVRQLGSIYEGLLEFKLRIADRKLAVVKEKGREVYVPFSDLDEKERERADRQDRVVRKGQAYLENDKRERKATGSYYTPDYIVQYIVEHAVGPVLQEKFKAMRTKLREAQQRRRTFFQKQEALRKQKLKPEPESKADFIGQEVVDETFDIKILDPAMGSGHFLVEAVDYITDKALDFLNAFPWNPVVAHLTRMRETILREMDEQGITIDAKRLTDVNLLKRQVLKRCIYGVDLNPMAVELAKVSLWLDCFTLGAPLSFLDHHLRCGNSLIGTSVKEVREALEGKEGEAFQLGLFGSRFAGLLLATDLMRHVGELSDVTSAQVQESRSEYRKASDALAPFKRILDTYTSQWFGNGGGAVGARRRRAQSDPSSLAFLKSRGAEAFINARDDKTLKRMLDVLSSQDRPIAETALTAATEKRFFHWELEFPEVFYGPRPGSTQLIERLEGAGFDAVIGNPPYIFIIEVPEDLRMYYEAAFETCSYRFDVYGLFVEKSIKILRSRYNLGLIIPHSMLNNNSFAALRKELLAKCSVIDVVDFTGSVFAEAANEPMILIAQSGRNENSVGKLRVAQCAPSEEALNAVLLVGASAKQFAQLPGSPFLTRGLGWVPRLLMRLNIDLESAGNHFKGTQGLRTGDNDKFIARMKANPSYRPVVGGSDIARYEIDWLGTYVLYDRNKLDAPRDEEFWRAREKLVVQEVRNVHLTERIIAAYDSDQLIALNTTNVLISRASSGYSLKFVLGVISSRLVNEFVRACFVDNHVATQYLEAIPFPHIEFTTSATDRKQQLQQLVSQYQVALESLVGTTARNSEQSVLAELLTAVGELGGSLRILLDVLHDLLAYLAEQMIELNKQKQAESRQFLGQLEKELKIQSDKNGNTGIEALAGKTTLKDYLGNYQKGEEHTPFETLWEVLRKNTRRLGRTLDAAFEQRMREEYEKSLALLLPIKQKLAATDWLIDQLVYRLYGLTEEEIAIVEGRK